MTLNNHSAEPLMHNGSANVSSFGHQNELNNSLGHSLPQGNNNNNTHQFVDTYQLTPNSAVLTMPSFGNLTYSGDNVGHCLNSVPSTMSPTSIGLDRQSWNSNDSLGQHERLINNHSNQSYLNQSSINNNVHNIIPNLDTCESMSTNTTQSQPSIPASSVLAQGLSSLLSTANITPPSEISLNNQNNNNNNNNNNNENVSPNNTSAYDIHYNNNHRHHHHRHHHHHHNQSNTLYMNGTLTNPDKSANEKICFGCHKTLSTSPIIASVSGYHNWHINCLCCSECGQLLSQSRSCYIRNGQIYCKDDYKKLIKCCKCDRTISSSDWVRRAGLLVYHLACFACDLCQRQLSTGEKFTIEKIILPSNISGTKNVINYRLVCKLHFGIKDEQFVSQQQHQPASISLHRSNNHIESNDNLCNSDHHARSIGTSPVSNKLSVSVPVNNNGLALKNCSTNPDSTGINLENTRNAHTGGINQNTNSNEANGTGTLRHNSIGCSNESLNLQPPPPVNPSSTNGRNSSLSTSSGSNSNSLSKTKRVRTTFTEDQLSVLQANFQLDSNPDGQDLERIATLTGLSKRVTQVWFQNSRARQKKFLNKNPSHHSHSNTSQQSTSAQRLPLTVLDGPIVGVGSGGQQSGLIINGPQQASRSGTPGLWSPTTTTSNSSNSSNNSGTSLPDQTPEQMLVSLDHSIHSYIAYSHQNNPHNLSKTINNIGNGSHNKTNGWHSMMNSGGNNKLVASHGNNNDKESPSMTMIGANQPASSATIVQPLHSQRQHQSSISSSSTASSSSSTSSPTPASSLGQQANGNQ